MRLVSLLPLLAACPAPEATPPTPDPVGLAALACGADEGVIAIETADGELLAADYRPGPSTGAGAVVLLHMAPTGGFHRGNWLPRVREALADTGVAVLNVDRRGAGDSTGDPEEAAEGPGALLDAEAAVRTLLSAENACAVDPARIVLFGASNGTTAALDYTVAHAAELPDPAGVAFLSPGTYTENQHALDPAALLLPMLWLYPDNEPYSQQFLANAPPSWRMLEVGSRHGTLMFDGGVLENTVVAELVAFLEANAG